MEKTTRDDIRNIAIIAHVDHGKTTLVDAMLRQSGIFRANEQIQERVMDSNDLERERGITILAKNTSVRYNGIKINIVDTPGHSDFGGEVERVLKMVDGVLLLVDSFEGPMPQTRFVLRKALELNLQAIVVVNKIDRPDERSVEVVDEVLDLFIDLEAEDEQLEFPIVYVSAKEGIAKHSIEHQSTDLKPLFETITALVPAPKGYAEESLQLLVSNIEHDGYIGRIGIGRIERGRLRAGQQVIVCKEDKASQPYKIIKLFQYEGLKRIEVEEGGIGDIVAFAGIPGFTIGDTLCDVGFAKPLPFVDIDEPTVSMTFGVNTSPMAGKEGTFVTSRHVRDRLYKELETNLSLRVEETESPDSYKVSGRGELHLTVLIENMRRQGYELQVSKPTVIMKEKNGVMYEPIEHLTIDVPEEFVGAVIEKLGVRKAEMIDMGSANQGYSRLEFKIPARGLIGYRSEFMTDTKGNGIMNHLFMGYEPFKGGIPERTRGSLVAFEPGETTTYGLYNAQERGSLFIEPGVVVYEGMVVGENTRVEDITVNVCKKKHVTNMRASGSDEALRLTPARKLSLEQSLEFIGEDELAEITPKNIRLRKKILGSELRAKAKSKL